MFFSGENCSQAEEANGRRPQDGILGQSLKRRSDLLRPYTQGKKSSLDLLNSEPIQWESQMKMVLKTNNE